MRKLPSWPQETDLQLILNAHHVVVQVSPMRPKKITPLCEIPGFNMMRCQMGSVLKNMIIIVTRRSWFASAGKNLLADNMEEPETVHHNAAHLFSYG